MEDFIFKKDYTRKRDTIPAAEATAEDILPSPVAREYLEFHTAFMRRLPKYIVPKDKETFERVLPKLNNLAKRLGGSIEAKVDYHKWLSQIVVVLPFFEIYKPEDAELFIDIFQNSHSFNVTATDDGNVRIYIMINYFNEIMPKDMNEALEIAGSIILEDDDNKK